MEEETELVFVLTGHFYARSATDTVTVRVLPEEPTDPVDPVDPKPGKKKKDGGCFAGGGSAPSSLLAIAASVWIALRRRR